MAEAWRANACILCSENCGLEVRTDGRRIISIRGDDAHPDSRGYLCQKASRLDYYQNHGDRLTQPLRRTENGDLEPVSWDRAIAEVASRLTAIRDRHGGHALAYYGGGGQGNHLGGVYGSSLRAAMDTPYVYSALAQEKTGDFWVNGKLFGRQTCHVTQGVADADFVVFLGTNPWQSHGFPRARAVLKEMREDPGRTMVVIDPRRTETAGMADIHLQVRPGTDAFLLAAMLGEIAREGLENRAFLAQRTVGAEEVLQHLRGVPVDTFAERAGVDPADVRRVAHGLAAAKAATIRADLGIQQSYHSTLNSYLEKLLFLMTGHFGRRGTNNLHTFLVPLIGHSPDPEDGHAALNTRVAGQRPIGKLYPPNILPAEIDADHPERVRGLVVDSGNPLVTAANTDAYRRAFRRLEVSVVIDVALTETAQLADYVLPASSQFEKAEATFFTLGFPENVFHLRRPLFTPLEGTLGEPEIYRRLVVAMGAMPDRFPVLERAARLDRARPSLRLLPAVLAAAIRRRPGLKRLLPLVLYRVLGPQLPNGLAPAAVLWGAARRYADLYPDEVRRAGIRDDGAGLGEALFQAILDGEHGMVLSEHGDEDTWSLVRHEDGKAHLAVEEMLEQFDALGQEVAEPSDEYPLLLMAGERRSYNANTIFRDPDWRKKDVSGAAKFHPSDAVRLGVTDGDSIRLESRTGEVVATVLVTDEMLPGVVSVPHGYGTEHAENGGDRQRTGPRVNELTASDHCDPLTRTPYHKTVPIRVVKPL